MIFLGEQYCSIFVRDVYLFRVSIAEWNANKHYEMHVVCDISEVILDFISMCLPVTAAECQPPVAMESTVNPFRTSTTVGRAQDSVAP